MGQRGGDGVPLGLDGVASPPMSCGPGLGSGLGSGLRPGSSYGAFEVEADASPYLARSVSAVDSGYRDDDDDDDEEEDDAGADSDSTCSSAADSGSGSSGVKDLVHGALHAADLRDQHQHPTTYGDISIRHSDNVQIGNNTHFHGKVTVLLSTSQSVNGVAVPAVLPSSDPDVVLAAAKQLEAERSAGADGVPLPPGAPAPGPGQGSSGLLTESQPERAAAAKFWRRPHFLVPAALGTLLVGALAITGALVATKGPGVPPLVPTKLPNGLTVIPRDEWVAQPPREGVNDLETPVEYVIIHHSATSMCYSHPECVKQTRYIQQFHMESRNWSDIAYNFLVGGDGYAYTGRGWDREGAHTFNWNARSVGVCLIGTFDYQRPTIEQLRSTLKLLEWGVALGKIVPEYKLAGMCQLRSSESPGREVFAEIKRWEHWWNYTVGDSNCK